MSISAPVRESRVAHVELVAPLVAAAAAGGALLLSFPRFNLWWLAPIGVLLLAWACHGRSIRFGALSGFIAGLTFFVPLLSWTGLQTGAWPWLLLATFLSVFFAGLGAASAAVSTLLVPAKAWLWTLVIGALWVTEEAARDRVPWGGFPWGRLAFSQGDSPLLRLASLGGAPLVTFVVAVCGAALAAFALTLPQLQWRAITPAALTIVIVGGLVIIGAPAATTGEQLTVAIVQGNVPRLGLEFNAQRRAVLDNHVAATLDLAAKVSRGETLQPTIVIWPENSSDIDPLINEDARAEIDRAAAAIRAPILVGAVLRGPGENVRNAGIVWSPTLGPGAMYVKQHPVPFAEYIPMRSLVRLITAKADLVRADFIAGRKPGVLQIGPATIGDVICFEVAYDDLVRATVTGGAGLIVVQTNNATFGLSAEAAQQLAMVRLRAVEHGRPALMASTTGISAFVDSDGTVHDATKLNTRAAITRTLRVGTSTTLATRLGPSPEWVLVAGAIAALCYAITLRRGGRASRPDAQ